LFLISFNLLHTSEIQAKTCSTPSRGHLQNNRKFCMATFAREKATAARFGLYLRDSWTDFGHFFNFKNPTIIFFKVY